MRLAELNRVRELFLVVITVRAEKSSWAAPELKKLWLFRAGFKPVLTNYFTRLVGSDFNLDSQL